MRGIAVFCVMTLVALVLSACSSEKAHNVDFYYWKSKCEIGPTEREYLDELSSKRLFVRLFDVDIEGGQAVPLAEIQSLDVSEVPVGVEVVPVVFITNRTFLDYVSDADIDRLVSNVLSGVRYFMQSGQLPYKEVQIDCDWTKRTRVPYFKFLTRLAEQSGCDVSCTLRLHQIRDRNITGVPPVTRGSLMCYATSSPLEGETRNSILDMTLLKAYTTNINDYPLPFDLILPIYSWGIVTNHLGKVKLINGLSDDDMQSADFEHISDGLYIVKRDCFVQGMYVNSGFTIKIETITSELLAEAKDYLKDNVKRDFDWVYFHLSRGFLKRYDIEELK